MTVRLETRPAEPELSVLYAATVRTPVAPMHGEPGIASPMISQQVAGHSVEVLLRVYAKCLDGGELVANKRIEAALKDV